MSPTNSSPSTSTGPQSQINQSSITEYDNVAFTITTPDSKAPMAGYLTAASLNGGKPARIGGADPGPGNRYWLDPKNTGNSIDYTLGPIIGAELDQFLAAVKTGGPLASPISAAPRGPVAGAPAVSPTQPAPVSLSLVSVAAGLPAATVAVAEHLTNQAGEVRTLVAKLKADLALGEHWVFTRFESIAQALEHLAKRV